MVSVEQEALELRLLLEAIYGRYGYDFRQYSQASVKRRVRYHLSRMGMSHIADLIPIILRDPEQFQNLFFDISITVTEMFRDPWFYKALSEKVFPFLHTFPYLNIWHAGCATGEEVYSLAILLKEAGLYERVQIYATDFNDKALAKAKARIYPLEQMKSYNRNYHAAGGKQTLSDYYLAQYDSAIFNIDLLRNVTFANHNLTTDGPFAEMHMILCRNVLIYFDQPLQDRALTTFRDSLAYNGFMCLGTKESLQFSAVVDSFEPFCEPERIYQSKRPSA